MIGGHRRQRLAFGGLLLNVGDGLLGLRDAALAQEIADRFRHEDANEEQQHRRDYAGDKDRAPSIGRDQPQADQRRQRQADRKRRHHRAGHAAADAGRAVFGGERQRDRHLAAEAEVRQEAEYRERQHVPRRTDEAGEQREDAYGCRERGAAADIVGDLRAGCADDQRWLSARRPVAQADTGSPGSRPALLARAGSSRGNPRGRCRPCRKLRARRPAPACRRAWRSSWLRYRSCDRRRRRCRTCSRPYRSKPGCRPPAPRSARSSSWQHRRAKSQRHWRPAATRDGAPRVSDRRHVAGRLGSPIPCGWF